MQTRNGVPGPHVRVVKSIVLLLLLTMWRSHSAQAQNTGHDRLSKCDLIFAGMYQGYFSNSLSKNTRSAITSPVFDPQHRGGWDHMAREVSTLPVAEKCRFALLCWLALPLDGEYGERFPGVFGADSPAVYARLSKIPLRELENTCAAMGYPRERAGTFRTVFLADLKKHRAN